MRRKPGTTWTPKAASTTRREGPKAEELSGREHRHGCPICSATHVDHCEDPLSDALCAACRGSSVPLWEQSLRPRPCCETECQLATPDEASMYRLGGSHQWWLCRTCKRPHIYNPEGQK